MTHYTDDDLILHYYGEGARRRAIDGHLETCDRCAAAFHAIAGALDLVSAAEAPERGDHYGLEVWQRIRHRLPERDARWWSVRFGPNRLALACAAGLAVAAAFVAGRLWPAAGLPPPAPVAQQAHESPADAGDRVRLAATSDHLERSERVLLDLVNGAPSGNRVDVTSAQAWATDLVDANRLYRQAAVRAGDSMVAGVLDDLERNLLEIVHGPSTLTAAQLEHLRVRLDAAALLFKVRVLHDALRERETTLIRTRNTT